MKDREIHNGNGNGKSWNNFMERVRKGENPGDGIPVVW